MDYNEKIDGLLGALILELVKMNDEKLDTVIDTAHKLQELIKEQREDQYLLDRQEGEAFEYYMQENGLDEYL